MQVSMLKVPGSNPAETIQWVFGGISGGNYIGLFNGTWYLMKLSPDVNHKSVVNWWKSVGCSTTDMSARSLFVSKLCKGLAAILFEIFSKQKFWWGSRPISVTQWQDFQISPKRWRIEIFRTSAVSRGNRVIHGVNSTYFQALSSILLPQLTILQK